MAKYAIITGGSRGLGEAMALRLAKMGYNIVINYISDGSAPKAEAVLKKAKDEYGAEGLAVQADVSEVDGAQKLVDEAMKAFGDNLEVLINNAGIQQNAYYVDTPIEKIHRIVQVNLVSAMNMCSLVAPIMQQNKKGCIISMSSTGGLMGVEMQTVYCATKSGIIGLTRGLALELAGDGIRVNAIAPGGIETDMLKELPRDVYEGAKQAVPLKMFGQPSDIADLMEYLVNAGYVTGQTISPNGGVIMPA